MNLLTRFHREESAQISFLAVASILCFVGLLSMVINTDDIITDRVHMQDVADTTSISSAAWTARGLNMISFINVMNSKLISTAVLMNALADTLKATETVGRIQQGIFQACSGVPFIGAFCAAYATVLSIQLAVLTPLKNLMNSLANSLSRCGKGSLWKIMDGLQKAARAVKESFTIIGLVEAWDMAQANGAEFGIVVNGNLVDAKGAKDLLSLPVKEDNFKTFCPFLKDGGSGYKMGGYECGTGPYRLGKKRIMSTVLIPFTNLFAHPIFLGMSAAHISQAGCTPDPSGSDDKFDVTLRDLGECQKYDQEATWSHLTSRTRRLTDGNLTVADFVPWKPLNEYEGDGKSEDDAPDQDTVEGQLGNINVPKGPVGGGGTTAVTMGKNYDDLLQSSERKGFPQRAEIDCDGAKYPPFSEPPGGFGSDNPGRLYCFGQIGSECKRIDEWSAFKWYSAKHIPNGPKDVGGYFIRVGKKTIEPPEDDENAPVRYEYLVETVSLSSAGSKKMDMDEFEKYMNETKKPGDPSLDLDTDNLSGSSCAKNLKPYVLDTGDTQQKKEDFQNRLKFFAVVWRDLDDDPPFWSNYFEHPPKVLVAYSQAQVYNHLSEDTFTQDWRVRLEQSSLLEEVIEKRLPGGTSSLGQGLKNFIGAVNNH